MARGAISEKTKVRITGLILLLALCAELYLLLHDVPILGRVPSKNTIAAPVIAELVRRNNEVRVQPAGSLVWEDGKDGQTLHRRQSILTLDDSKAEIAFLDGTGIVLDENSMVTLEKTPTDDSLQYQKIVIHLLRGGLHKRAPRKASELLKTEQTQVTPEIEVRTPDLTLPIAPMAEFSLLSSREGPNAGTRVIVQAGEMTATSSAGDVRIRAGEEAMHAPAAAQAPVPRKISLLLGSPRSGETVDLGEDSKLRLKWEASEAIAGRAMELELSSDPSFSREVTRMRIPASQPPMKFVQASVELPRKSGKWHWRVRTLDGSATSAQESFWTSAPEAPKLLFPAAETRVSSSRSLEFSWAPVEGSTGYELEVAGKVMESRDPFTRIEQLNEGESSWRVRARLRDGSYSEWSEPRSFLASAVAEAPPPPPAELSEPEIQPVTPEPRHTWFFFLFREAIADDAPTWLIHLKWQPVAGVEKYRVQIARERSFNTIIAELQTDAPAYSWSYRRGMENSKGRVFYRVASVSKKGVVGRFSDARPIQIPKSILAQASSEPETPIVQATPSPSAPQIETVAESPKLQPTPAPRASTPEPVLRRRWAAAAQLHTGFGSIGQSATDAALQSVSMEKPFLQQKVGLDLSRLASTETLTRGTEAALEIGLMSFHRPSTQETGAQPDVRAMTLQALALRSFQRLSPWSFKAGVVATTAFRFEKISPQAVSPSSGVAFGPAFSVLRSDRLGEAGSRLTLPLLGAHKALNAALWYERRLLERQRGWFGLRAEGEYKASYWSVPEGTRVSSWTFWLAPTFHFGQEEPL